MTGACIHDIQYVLGEPRELSMLSSQLGISATKDLYANGLEFYRESALTAPELGIAALEKSLAHSGLPPEALDLIFYCSEDTPSQFSALCVEHGLRRVPIIETGNNACSNLVPPIRLAESVIRTEGLMHVAVIVADRAHSGRSRLTQHNTAILSDGAAAFIMSRTWREGWEVLRTVQTADHRVGQTQEEQYFPLRVGLITRGVRKVLKTLCGGRTLEQANVSTIFTANLKDTMLRGLMKEVGVPFGYVYQGTLASISHVFAADPIISLAEAYREQANEQPANCCFVLLCLGFQSWGAVLLKSTSTAESTAEGRR
jgi:3-oxoacyl-[acyl-carrier-protein] synthase III